MPKMPLNITGLVNYNPRSNEENEYSGFQQLYGLPTSSIAIFNIHSKQGGLFLYKIRTLIVFDNTYKNLNHLNYGRRNELRVRSSLIIIFVLFVAKNMDKTLCCSYGSDAGCWFLDT
jgi:hypothetical protein